MDEVLFDRYVIRRATYDDIDLIRKYIEENWRKDHIMARDRAFVEYEIVDDEGQVSCILAIDVNTNVVEGIFMYIYSSYTEGYRDIWGSMYSVKPGNNAWLGIELMKQVQILSACRNYIGFGCNPNTSLKLARIGLKRKPAKLSHYYALSDRSNSDYRIAKVVKAKEMQGGAECPENATVSRVTNPEELKNFMDGRDKETVPYKDYAYILKRYFNHPIYKYEIYAIKRNDMVLATFVVRKQEYDGRIALRMIDFIGDRSAFAYTNSFWKKMLADKATEYVDFYSYGFETEYMNKAGFTTMDEDDENIIPNYFSPFLCANIDIWSHSKDGNVFLCKGDGDQDRPG